MKFRFTPDDFEKCPSYEKAHVFANAALDKHLESLPVVYGRIPPGEKTYFCGSTQNSSDTHRAILWDIEKIKKKECEHAAVTATRSGYICAKCGVKLKATWTAETKEG